jgi:hypothetical protein
MAKRFLTDINLAGNQLINASFEQRTADPAPSAADFEGRMYYNTNSNTVRIFDGASWIAVGAITAVNGTTNEVEVSTTNGVVTVSLPSTINADTTGNAATATKLATSRTIELTGDVTGSASFDGSANASITATIAANSVALGTDTTGDYVASVSAGTGIGITGTGEGAAVTVSNTGVTSVAGTANQIAASASTGSVTLSLPSAITVPGSLTLNADPTADLHAATKAYVDAKVNGLTWKPSANLLANSNVALTGTSGTLVIDGHSALGTSNVGYRIVLISQTTGAENGIYTYADNGSNYTLSRAADGDVYSELIGASIFINEGTAYGKTSWVQSNHYLTNFNGQVWTQVAGQGTYVAGNGLTLTGNSFSIDTSITVDKNTTQTLTNKTLTNPTVSGLYISDNTITIEGTTDSFETTVNFTDPTADRTITFQDASGTVAYTGDVTSAINALTTSDIEEGTNLYYTDTRVNSVLSTGGYTKKVSASVGNGSATSFAVTHNLGTRDIQVQVYDNATYDTVEVDVVRTSTSVVTVSFATAPSSNAYRVVVVG